MEILIFKTSIESRSDVDRLRPRLDRLVCDGRWTVDLEDCDRVLRIESAIVGREPVFTLLQEFGFACAELED